MVLLQKSTLQVQLVETGHCVCGVVTTYALLEELGRCTKGGGSRVCPNCRACKELVEHVLFECVSHNSQRLISLNYLYSFKAFLHHRIFNKTALSS